MLESVASIVTNYLLPYLILSILAMLIVEMLAAVFQLRALVLRRFIRGMLNDPDGSGLSRDFYSHHLIRSLADGTRLPSYIPSRLFAAVVSELLASDVAAEGSGHQPGSASHPALAKGLSALRRLPMARERTTALRQWFNDVMDGASGSYRLRTMGLLLAVATVMVVGVDFDAVRISTYVARREIAEKTATARLEAAAKADNTTYGESTREVLASLDSVSAFPLGWRLGSPMSAPSMILGLTISILAIVLTAPFLFDLLNRFMVVRSTVKPYYDAALEDPALEAPIVSAHSREVQPMASE